LIFETHEPPNGFTSQPRAPCVKRLPCGVKRKARIPQPAAILPPHFHKPIAHFQGLIRRDFQQCPQDIHKPLCGSKSLRSVFPQVALPRHFAVAKPRQRSISDFESIIF
jgi:hypothetical protein